MVSKNVKVNKKVNFTLKLGVKSGCRRFSAQFFGELYQTILFKSP